MSTATAPSWRQTGLVAPLFWAVGAALIVPVWTGAHFPSEDGFAHLAWTEVYRALGTADSRWAPFYARAVHWNTPNLAYFGLQYGLGSLVGPHIAQQFIVSALIGVWVATTYVLSLALTRHVTLGAFASLLLIHSSWLYGGYFSFLTGVPPLLLALALVVRIMTRSPASTRGREVVLLALLGIVTYYCHLTTAAMFLLLVAIAVIFLRGSPRLAAAVALASVPVAVLVASYLLLDSLGPGGVRWEPISKTVARFVGLAFFRGFAAPTPAFWFALAMFAAVVVALCFDVARSWWAGRASGSTDRGTGSRASKLVLVLAVCLAVLYVFSPEGVGEGYNLKGRFQLVMWAWLLPSLAYTGLRPRRELLVAVVVTLLGWQVTVFGLRARRFNAAFEPVVTSAARLTPGSTIERDLAYEQAGFDGSFIKVLAHAPEDFAYHCRCVLVSGYHPSTAFYWVRDGAPRDVGRARAIDYRIQVRGGSGAAITVLVTKPSNGASADRGTGTAPRSSFSP